MPHYSVEIDDFIHGTRIIFQSCTHTQSLWYDWTIQEVKKHFVHDLGARPQHGVDREDYEEGIWENDTIIMDPLHFGDNENWLGSQVGRQSYVVDFVLSEDMEAFDVGGRHLGSHGIQLGLYEDDEEEYNLDDF